MLLPIYIGSVHVITSWNLNILKNITVEIDMWLALDSSINEKLASNVYKRYRYIAIRRNNGQPGQDKSVLVISILWHMSSIFLINKKSHRLTNTNNVGAQSADDASPACRLSKLVTILNTSFPSDHFD